MAADSKPTDRPGTLDTPAAGTPATREQLMEQYQAVLEEIPFAADDDGFGIVARILTATDWEQLNNDDGLDNMQNYAGEQLRVLSVERRESTIDGGLPWYLMVDALTLPDRRPVKVNTSAASVMAKLAMLHHFGKLPATVKITQADKPTRGGKYPLDLTVLMVTP